jgi:phosphonopyruvate decarboxylase
MVNCATLDTYFLEAGVSFFTGVPDSCFKPWIDYLLATRKNDHVIATNEGEALTIAAGYNLATGKTGGVYLQNSGLGNLLNPLTSIIDEHVYNIPVLLMISWRGRPGQKDEPQHERMGRNTTTILEAFDIPYSVFGQKDLQDVLQTNAVNTFKSSKPYALIFQKGDIEPYPIIEESREDFELTRWNVIQSIAQFYGKEAVFFATTGMTSRELYEWREMSDKDHSCDFLNVGGMGWVSSIAFGFSLRSKRRMVILDGDGSVLMHMGNLATIGHYRPSNIMHFILDNNAHDSVGCEGTVSETVDFAKLAEAVGYRASATVTSSNELRSILERLDGNVGPALVTIKIRKGSRPDLPRPSLTPRERKTLFLARIRHNVEPRSDEQGSPNYI